MITEIAEPKKLYLLNLKRNLTLEHELFRIISYLNEYNIASIPLKGPLMARFLCGDSAVAKSAPCDLDLLAHESDLKKAEKCLSELGYEFTDAPDRIGVLHKFAKQISLKKRGEWHNGILLDLHWGFRNRFTDTHLNEFWSGAAYVNFDGHEILMPAKEDLLLYLSLIAIYDDCFVQAKYLKDISSALKLFGGEIDWDKLIYKAKRHGLKTALFLALKLSKELFGANLEDKVLKSITPHPMKMAFLNLFVNKKNVLDNQKKFASTYFWRHFLSSFILSKDIFDCLKIIFKKIFIPMEEAMAYWGQPISKVSYPLYIRRLLKPCKPNTFR